MVHHISAKNEDILEIQRTIVVSYDVMQERRVL